MLWKIATVSALSTLLSTTCFSSIYLGAATGPEGLTFLQNVHVSIPGHFNVLEKNSFSGTGVFGSLFLGYEKVYGRWYVAAEVNGNISSVYYQLTNDEYFHGTYAKTTFTVKNSEGVSLLPGIVVTPDTVFYARIGYANGKIVISQSNATVPSTSGNQSGLRYGLGIRNHFAPHWSLMVDYSQINYQSLQVLFQDPMVGLTKTTKVIPNTAQVAFGLIYNFEEPPVTK